MEQGELMGSSAKERENVTGVVDKYRGFAELSARERLGEYYTIDVVEQGFTGGDHCSARR